MGLKCPLKGRMYLSRIVGACCPMLFQGYQFTRHHEIPLNLLLNVSEVRMSAKHATRGLTETTKYEKWSSPKNVFHL